MKRADDPRHIKRVKIVEELFARSFNSKSNSSYKKIAVDIMKLSPQIDNFIQKSAPAYPVNKIAKIDVAILRLAVYELCFKKNEPLRVIIDEAVELAKKFGGETSPSFINGVLGSIISTTADLK